MKKQSKTRGDWIKKHLLTIGVTSVQFAKQMKMEPASLSRLVNCKRGMSAEEALNVARIFSMPLDEVMRLSGMPTDAVEATKGIELSGWVDAGLSVHWGHPRGPKRAPRVEGLGKEVAALRFQTVGSPIGRLSIVSIETPGEENRWVLRVPKRGYLPGKFSLYDLGGELREEEMRLNSLAVILLMQF